MTIKDTNTMTAPKLKIGILSFAHMHAHSYAHELRRREDVEIAGIWDSDGSRGQEMADNFGTTYYELPADLLATGLDGVIVASENIFHRSLVEESAAAGVKAILCEKPLAPTVADAEAMVRACADAGVKLATAFPCRHAPAFKRLRDQVQSGALGEILAIRGTNRGSNPGGWFVDTQLSGGGAIMDHTVHVADLIWQLLGKEAVDVYAESGNGFYHQDWDDTGFLTIGYGNGVFATLDTSWSRPKSYPTWGDVTLQVIGRKGVIDLDLFGQSLEHYSSEPYRTSWNYWGSSMDGGLVAEFVKLCKGETSTEIATGEDGLRAVAIVAAAYASVKQGRPELLRV